MTQAPPVSPQASFCKDAGAECAAGQWRRPAQLLLLELLIQPGPQAPPSALLPSLPPAASARQSPRCLTPHFHAESLAWPGPCGCPLCGLTGRRELSAGPEWSSPQELLLWPQSFLRVLGCEVSSSLPQWAILAHPVPLTALTPLSHDLWYWKGKDLRVGVTTRGWDAPAFTLSR